MEAHSRLRYSERPDGNTTFTFVATDAAGNRRPSLTVNASSSCVLRVTTMNKFPWLKPLLTLVVALALGAGMLFLGTTFAPHQQVAVESGTETVPVVAPIAIGDEEPAADAESEQLAEREVRLPGAVVDGLDPSVQAVIDELAVSADPTYDITVFDGDSEGDDSSVGDDSCAPRDGDPADCPDGIRSTILPLIHLRDFNAGVEVFPPGGVYGTLLEVCDAATLNPTDGSIPLGIVATAPGAFDLEFWPTADSGAPHVEVSVNTPDDQRTAFETAVATAESVDDVPILKFCLTVAGLEPNTAYTGVLTGLADDDRVMRPHTFRFNTTGDPVHPGLQLVPVGENLLFASALHPDDETVDIRAFMVDAGTVPSCALTTGQIFPLTFADTTVDADRLNALNVEAGFRQQHSETFRVSPGATVVVCARWFEDGSDTTSWEREQSIYESSAIAQSPDRMVPTLTISDWHDGTASPLQRVRDRRRDRGGRGLRGHVVDRRRPLRRHWRERHRLPPRQRGDQRHPTRRRSGLGSGIRGRPRRAGSRRRGIRVLGVEHPAARRRRRVPRSLRDSRRSHLPDDDGRRHRRPRRELAAERRERAVELELHAHVR